MLEDCKPLLGYEVYKYHKLENVPPNNVKNITL
jgi:hypothetical protein